jgi:hypothetical protein
MGMGDGKISGLTEEKLKKFVKVRNKSEFQTNFQFISDCLTCGFDPKDLPTPIKGSPEAGDEFYYIWHTPFGILVEGIGYRYSITKY